MQLLSNQSVKSISLMDERLQRVAAVLSPKLQWRIIVAVLLISDVLAAGAAFLAAYLVRFRSELPVFQLEVEPELQFYFRLSMLLVGIWLILLGVNGLYQRRNILGGTREYDLVFRVSSMGILAIIVFGFIQLDLVLARGWLLLAWVFSFLFISIGRFMLRRVVYQLRGYGFFLSPAIIVGANEEGVSLAEQLINWHTSGLFVVGFVDDHLPAGRPVYKHLANLGSTQSLQDLIAKRNLEEVIIATSALTRSDIVGLFQEFGFKKDLNLRLSSGLFELVTTGLEVKELAFAPLVRVKHVRLTGIDRFLKFTLDYILTTLIILFLLPMLLMIALFVYLDSPGPIIYRREVMGLNGRRFNAFKFRTMRVDGDAILEKHPQLKAELARTHKLKDDPRITRIGKFLRKTSLDELPQLLNVLLGDMSLVGPRMISPAEMEMYDQWGMNLLTVRPGITGLWQVSGRSDVSYEERVNLDMRYIRHWTIWLDIFILIQTIPAVFRGRGAY